jgi:hypothetical protein
MSRGASSSLELVGLLRCSRTWHVQLLATGYDQATNATELTRSMTLVASSSLDL